MSAFTTAKRLITKHGRNITLKKTSTVPADPNNPQDGTNTAPETLVVKAVQDQYSEEQIGDVVERGDIKFLVWGGEAQDIETYDTLTDGTKTWKIINVDPIRPGILTYLYEIQARR